LRTIDQVSFEHYPKEVSSRHVDDVRAVLRFEYLILCVSFNIILQVSYVVFKQVYWLDGKQIIQLKRYSYILLDFMRYSWILLYMRYC